MWHNIKKEYIKIKAKHKKEINYVGGAKKTREARREKNRTHTYHKYGNFSAL